MMPAKKMIQATRGITPNSAMKTMGTPQLKATPR
jgi:hypothetical protein